MYIFGKDKYLYVDNLIKIFVTIHVSLNIMCCVFKHEKQLAILDRVGGKNEKWYNSLSSKSLKNQNLAEGSGDGESFSFLFEF